MQLVPKQLAEVLSQDIDITNPQAQELLITNLMENIVQSEDLFPAEMADKYIWIFNMFDKEKAYWQDKYMLAARYVEAFEKMEERAKLCLRKLMDGQTLYGTDQKIEPENYKDQKLSYINESKLQSEEYTYDITKLSFLEYNIICNILHDYFYRTSVDDDDPQTKDVISVMDSIRKKLKEAKKNPFTISKLPKGHPAIVEKFKEMVKIKPLTQKELKGKR